jgi:hypothetical protein
MDDTLCPTCQQNMPYAVMYRDDPNSPRWKYYKTCILGKDNAYAEMYRAQPKHPEFAEWRVLPKNVADAMIYGMNIGRTLARMKMQKRKESQEGRTSPSHTPTTS